jgi:prepilin-type N-terminal cleavage/methylation domain-containing protein
MLDCLNNSLTTPAGFPALHESSCLGPRSDDCRLLRQSRHGETFLKRQRQSGFTFIEMIVALAIVLSVAAIILAVTMSMARTQGTVSNRTEMHASIRSATELLQQEIGQAGRVASPASLSAPVTLTGAGSACAGLPGASYLECGDGAAHTLSVSSSTGLFPGEILTIGPDTAVACPGAAPVYCASRENIQINAVGANTITAAVWQDPHNTGSPVSVLGVYASGIVPPYNDPNCLPAGAPVCSETSWSTASNTTVKTLLTAAGGAAPGSSATLLKMFGDINGDGNMVYVEYACNQGTAAAPGTFQRRVIPYNTALVKNTTNFPWQTLLSNVLANPGGTPCFAFQTTAKNDDTYVVNVAVTLTVQTQNVDPQTGQFQTETKALLNISPRNVFEAYLMSAGGVMTRVQPMPQTVVNLLSP